MPADALRAASAACGSNIGSASWSRNWLSSNINFREARTVILPEVKGFGLSKKLQTKLDDLSHQAWIIDTPRPTRHMDIKDIRMSCCLLVHTEGLPMGFPDRALDRAAD